MMSQQSLPSRALRVMLELSPTAQIFQTLKCASKSLHQLTASWDTKARIWDIEHGYLKKTLVHPTRSSWVEDCSFSRDGRLVLTVCDDDAFLWEVATGRLLTRFEGHTGRVHCGVFSPDDKYVVTSGYDGTARVWPRPSPALDPWDYPAVVRSPG